MDGLCCGRRAAAGGGRGRSASTPILPLNTRYESSVRTLDDDDGLAFGPAEALNLIRLDMLCRCVHRAMRRAPWISSNLSRLCGIQ
jgi:hypothetical protein